jgi:hypothetical protein
MTQHFLLSKADFRSRARIGAPENSRFNQKRGYWQLDVSHDALVRSGEAALLSGSKKCDMETGEDQKGE